jgi:hypothetical protein
MLLVQFTIILLTFNTLSWMSNYVRVVFSGLAVFLAFVIINTNENLKTEGQFAIDFQQNNGGMIPVINGKPEPILMFGYVSESDKQACIRLIREAVVATNGDVYKAADYIRNAVTIAANDIKPDEVVDVDGNEMLISYSARAIYLDTVEIANLDDMGDTPMDNEVIKALLKAKATIELQNLAYELDDFDDDEEDY